MNITEIANFTYRIHVGWSLLWKLHVSGEKRLLSIVSSRILWKGLHFFWKKWYITWCQINFEIHLLFKKKFHSNVEN